MDTVTRKILEAIQAQGGFSDSLELFTGATASNASQVAADTRLIAQYTAAAASNASDVAKWTGLTASAATEIARSVLGLRTSTPGPGSLASFANVLQLTNTLIASPGASLSLVIHKLQGAISPTNTGSQDLWFRDGSSGNRYFNVAFISPVQTNFNFDLDAAPWKLPVNTALTMVGGAGASAAVIATVVYHSE